MEVLGVFEEGVVGGEIGAAAKPPHRSRFEVAVVEVHRRDVGVPGVQHHRRAGGKPRVTLGLRPLTQDRGGQLIARHLGEIHAALLKNAAALHHPGTAPATLRPDPTFFCKVAAAIELFQARTDGILQTHQQGLRPGAGVGGGSFQGWGRAGSSELVFAASQQRLKHRARA